MDNKLICSLLLLIAATSTYAAGIEGGVPTNVSGHSYIVSIQGEDGEPICAGVLVKKNIVVTSATCINFYDPDQLVVGVNNGTRIVKIAEHIFNPDFDFTTMENDVALLQLAESVNASYVTLASRQRPSGFAGVLIGLSANNTLVKVDETIINAKDCVSGMYNYGDGEVFDTMLCGVAKNNACGALPGSPLFSKNRLVGLVSWGYSCDNKDQPTIFSKISALISWIKSTEKSF